MIGRSVPSPQASSRGVTYGDLPIERKSTGMDISTNLHRTEARGGETAAGRRGSVDAAVSQPSQSRMDLKFPSPYEVFCLGRHQADRPKLWLGRLGTFAGNRRNPLGSVEHWLQRALKYILMKSMS